MKKKIYCQNCGRSVPYRKASSYFGAFGRKCKSCKSRSARFTHPSISWNREMIK